MAFCTTCGSSVTGSFCQQCGTPAAGAATTPGTPPPVAVAGYAPPAATVVGVPVKRKTSPIVWVLVIVLGLFVLGGVAVVGVIGYVAHRAKQAGFAMDRGSDGGISFQARGADGKNARVEIGTKAKLPSWIPGYPGSEPAFSIKGSGDDGEGGNFSFTTSDSVSQVMSFYQDKIKELGMKAEVTSTSSSGGSIVAADEAAEKRSLTVAVVGDSSSKTVVNVTYGSKDR